jgi:2-polyprenyl-3-methyl-5-hydroxy-6-metoxy-1,4-benzoquinol methylase
MLNTKSLELTAEKQSKFWAAPVDHYKAGITAKAIFDLNREFVGRQVLDVGAADGSMIRYVRAHSAPGVQVCGVDLAPKNPEVMKANCTALPFANASFDTVFLTDVVEHLATEDLHKCMKESARVLKTGGHMIISTLNDEDLSENLILCPHCTEHFHRWGHCQTFTPETLGTVVGREGFEVKRVHKTNLGLLVNRPFLARIAYLLGITRFYKTKTFEHDLLLVARKS